MYVSGFGKNTVNAAPGSPFWPELPQSAIDHNAAVDELNAEKAKLNAGKAEARRLERKATKRRLKTRRGIWREWNRFAEGVIHTLETLRSLGR